MVPTGYRRHLVGREREQDQLRACLMMALRGHGRLVLIGGEAGIGKTSLVRDLIRDAAELGALVLTGGCYDLAATPPYGPWSELFESYAPDDTMPSPPVLLQSEERSEPMQSQASLFAAVRHFFGAISETRPAVAVLEDLHWSDQSSLDLLRYLARKVHDLPLLIVVTYRNDALTRDHPLYQLLPLIARETDAERLELQRLDSSGVREMVAHYGLPENEATRLTAYLEKRAGGNPFFTTELLRALENEGVLRVDGSGAVLGDLDEGYLPSFVMQVIDRRLAGLDVEVRRALEVAAVIGQEIPLEVWESVSRLEQAELASIIERALEAHVLESSPDNQRLRFSHALVREVLYGSTAHYRRDLHRCVAEAHVKRPVADPGVVAYHLQQAGDERAPEWLVLAGLQARRSAAWIIAAERFRSAAELLDRSDSVLARLRGWLLLYTGFLLRFSGDPETLAYLGEAEREAAVTGDALLLAYVRCHRGSARCIRGDIRRGIAEIQEGVEALEGMARTRAVLQTEEQVLAALRDLLPHLAGSTDNIVASSPAPDGTSPPVVQQRGVLVHWLAHSGQYLHARDMGEDFVANVTAAYGDGVLLAGQSVSGLLGLGHALAALGQPDDARRQYLSARNAYTAVGDYTMAEYSTWVELLMVTLPYRPDQTAERNRLLSEAVQAWDRAIGTTLGASHATHCKLLIDFLEGRWSEARSLAVAGEQAPIAPQFQGAIVTLGVLARHQGEPDLARGQVLKLLPEGPDTEPGDSYFPHAHAAQRLAAELALDAGDLDLAQHWIDAHRRWQEWSGATLWRADQHLLEARHHLLAGELDPAVEQAEIALEQGDDPRQPLVLIAAHRLLGSLEAQRGNTADARKQLELSMALAGACGAPFEQALTLVELGGLAASGGDPVAARSSLDRARRIAVSLDAKPLLARIDEVEARLDDAPVSYPDGLTSREVEILRLVAAGKSNQQIASDLFLSSRTVERHVANIYRKIDAHNRAEATAYALGRHLV